MKLMFEIEVDTSVEGNIRLSQSYGGGGPQVIFLHPDQVKTFTDWLIEVSEDLLKNRSGK